MIITTAGATALRDALTQWFFTHTAPGPDYPDGFRERFFRERVGRWTPDQRADHYRDRHPNQSTPPPSCPIHGTELLHAPATGTYACQDPTCRYAHGYPEPLPGPDVCGPGCRHPEPEKP